MKTLLCVLISGAVLTPLESGLIAQTKKYDIKSGIITFETTITMGSMKMTNKSIVYFDDYGMKECKETFAGEKLKEVFFSDGKDLYTVVPAEKQAFARGAAYRGTELRFDWDEVSSRDKKAGKAKKLANVTVAGKTCESFEQTSSSGKTVFAGWGHICLLTDLTSSGMHSVTKAVTIKENIPVPAEKFKVPPGYSIQ